jgi:putative FmdB family regulatory protein
MPVYDHVCRDCGDTFADVRSMKDPQPTVCNKCDGVLRQVYHLPSVRVDNTNYTCPVTGKPIQSRQAHKDNLKRHGCVEANEVYGSEGKPPPKPGIPDFKITKDDLDKAKADLAYGRAPRGNNFIPELDG